MRDDDSVHRQASDVAARLVGQEVTGIYLRGVAHATLVGEVITVVEAQGRHLVIGVGDRMRVHVRAGSTGHLRLLPRAALSLATAARASLVVATAEVAAVWTHAHGVEMVEVPSLHEQPLLGGLGPDPLAEAFDADQAIARARAQPADTPIGELMLDQRVVAGVGNVHKNEALFLERLDPWMPLARLDDDALGALFGRARVLMRHELGPAHRATGAATAARGSWGRPGRGRLHVYRRRGRPCHVCGMPIAAAPQGTPPRSTYFCPRCQGRAAPAGGAADETGRAHGGGGGRRR